MGHRQAPKGRRRHAGKCKAKVEYTRKEAQEAAKRIGRRKGYAMYAYPCEAFRGAHWHISRMPVEGRGRS